MYRDDCMCDVPSNKQFSYTCFGQTFEMIPITYFECAMLVSRIPYVYDDVCTCKYNVCNDCVRKKLMPPSLNLLSPFFEDCQFIVFKLELVL